MSSEDRSFTRTLANLARTIFWVALLLIVIRQARGPSRLDDERASVLDRFQQQRKSRAIAIIHREETVSLFGVPVSRYIDIDDSEAVLRAIRLTPTDQPIDLILHTPGGLVLAAEQIGHALAEHEEKSRLVPHYARTGHLTPHGTSGQDPKRSGRGPRCDMPAASLVKMLDKPTAQIGDECSSSRRGGGQSRIRWRFVTEYCEAPPREGQRARRTMSKPWNMTAHHVEGARVRGCPSRQNARDLER